MIGPGTILIGLVLALVGLEIVERAGRRFGYALFGAGLVVIIGTMVALLVSLRQAAS